MDLFAQFAIVPSSSMQLRSAKGQLAFDGEGKPMTVKLYSPSTAEFRAAQADYQRAVMARLTADPANGSHAAPADPDASLITDAEFLARITVPGGFSHWPERLGAQSLDAYKALYADPQYIAIVRQINGWVQQLGNFSAESAKA